MHTYPVIRMGIICGALAFGLGWVIDNIKKEIQEYNAWEKRHKENLDKAVTKIAKAQMELMELRKAKDYIDKIK